MVASASFLYLQAAYSQSGYWNDNLGNASTIKTHTTDKVGIGTNTPLGRLEVSYCPTSEKGVVITRENSCGAGGGYQPFTWIPEVYDVFVPLNSNPGYTIIWPSNTEPHELLPINLAYSPVLYTSYTGVNPTVGTGGGGTVTVPVPPEQPLFVAKKIDVTNPTLNATRFIVTPEGLTGINMPSPRVPLDVRGPNDENYTTAIFGCNGGNASGSFTKHVQVVSNLGQKGYNDISKSGDLGIFFTDGLFTRGENTGSGFVLAPWSADPNAGGLRMEANGNTELRGELRCAKLRVNATWWPDRVFTPQYQLASLASVSQFIQKNGHLPGVPSEAEVLANGQDVGALQQIQQTKIEEVTLYIINQDIALEQKDKQIANILKNLEAQSLAMNKALYRISVLESINKN
jgi:hypothetical protein